MADDNLAPRASNDLNMSYESVRTSGLGSSSTDDDATGFENEDHPTLSSADWKNELPNVCGGDNCKKNPRLSLSYSMDSVGDLKSDTVYSITKTATFSPSISSTIGTIRSDKKRLSRRTAGKQNTEMLWDNLTTLLSYIYAAFVVVFAAVVTVLRPHIYVGLHRIEINDVFFTTICFVGLAWLAFLHVDLSRLERRAVKERDREKRDTDIPMSDYVSEWSEDQGRPVTGYSYLTGRHSGSFYLKVGMTVFCCGHLIHEGLLLGKEVIGWMHGGEICADISLLVVHVVRPIFSFYQLYFLFKYSNIVINRWVVMAKFGIMHCFATTLSYWFRTIVDDAYGDVIKANKHQGPYWLPPAESERFSDQPDNLTNLSCATADLFSPAYLAPMQYLYPFTIEFDLLLAGVWFIVLQNLGKHGLKNSHKRYRSSEETTEKNLVISVDCHSANRGIFAGIVVLLASIVVMVVFYVTVLSEEHNHTGVIVYLVQEGVLLSLAFVASLLAYARIVVLDINSHPITFLDDFLLCIPLPFYFLHGMLVVIANLQTGGSWARILLQIFSVIQVVVQTPLIIDGLRRCSNSHVLRYKKPGREVVSFLIVINITMWIVYTFERKMAVRFFMGIRYYGLHAWVFVEHTTIPLMLFYRFHSSVCLADMWKSAYEAE
ncbi:proton channel OtopLc [Ixodes scapularis]|nr:proton channel OtopLc [Ixodes scapularis]